MGWKKQLKKRENIRRKHQQNQPENQPTPPTAKPILHHGIAYVFDIDVNSTETDFAPFI